MSPIAKRSGKIRVGPRFWLLVAALGVTVAFLATVHRADHRADESSAVQLERCQAANPTRAIQWYLIGRQPMTSRLARLKADLVATPGFSPVTGTVDCKAVLP